MGTATIKFQASSYKNNHDLVRSFRNLITPCTGYNFKRADIKQDVSDVNNPDFAALTLHSTNGFIIKVNGLHCGREGEGIVDLIRFCGFEIEDATIYNILNREKMNITIWNKKYI